MNRHLSEAIFEKDKVKAIMLAIEQCCLDLEVESHDRPKADMAVAMFYVLQDAIDRLADELDKLEGDCRVVDAIYAANDVRKQRNLDN